MLTIPRCVLLLFVPLYVLHIPAFAQEDPVVAPPQGLQFDLRDAVQAALKSPRPLFAHSEPAPARAWTQQLPARPDAETFNCALSFAIGGDIRRSGYIGVSALGQTRALQGGALDGKR